MVREAMGDACISTVNLTETLGRFAGDGIDPTPMARKLAETSLEAVPFSSAQALICAQLLPATRALGLSLGDRACLALAAERDIAAMTADRVWTNLDIDVAIRLIR